MESPMNDLHRRRFLTQMTAGAGALGLLQARDVFSSDDESSKLIQQSVSEHARPTSHDPEVHKLPRWRSDRTGPYNLSRATDNHYAWAKVQANLGGHYSWLAQYGWITMAPPGKPAFPILGRVQLAQIFATPADESFEADYGEHDYVLWGTFTTTHVDPRTFQPVDRILNPYTGSMIDVPTIHYADRLMFRLGQSIVVPGVDPAFYDQPWDRDGGYSQHHLDVGNDISYTVLGSSQQDGGHQPRCDVGFWTARRQAVMDPTQTGVDTRRDYSAIMKVSEYAWYGVEKGDDAQLLVHLTGLKSENLARLPGLIRPVILDRFQDRFIV